MSVEITKDFFSEFSIPSYEDWKIEAEKALKGAPFDKKMYTPTYEGITLNPIYNKEDRDSLPTTKNQYSGAYPYLRGTSAAGYTKGTWYISQEIPYPTPEEFNAAAKNDLGRGQSALNIQLNKASAKISANAIKNGSDAYQGLYLSTVNDMEKAFDGIDLTKVPVYINAGTQSVAVTALFAAYCRKNGIDIKSVKGGIEMDVIGGLAGTGKACGSLDALFTEACKLTGWMKDNAPQMKSITINGAVFADGGASAVQELAFAMSSAVEYLRRFTEMGLTIDEIAPRFRFKFGIGQNFFMEIAKFRAARMLWAKIVKEFGGNEESQKIFMHTKSSNVNKTKYDPYVNLLRITSEAFSAVIGGCDSMHLSYVDEAFGLPNDFTRRITRNVQNVFADETHFKELVDPAGGSYYVEALTYQVTEKAWELFSTTEKDGGMIASLQGGKIQAAIKLVTDERNKNLEVRKDTLLGTNKYANLLEKPVTTAKVYGQEVFDSRMKAFNEFCNNRDSERVYGLLKNLTEEVKAQAGKCFDIAIDAAQAGASSNELLNIFKDMRGETTEVEPIKEYRAGAKFEELRQAAEDFKAANGDYPKVYLASFGAVRDWKGRSDFSLDFFQVAAFKAQESKGFNTNEDACKAFLESGAEIVVICSTDEKYPEFVPEFTKMVKEAKPSAKVVLAGYPKDHIDAFKAAGVDDFIHVKANAYEINYRMQKETGIRK